MGRSRVGNGRSVHLRLEAGQQRGYRGRMLLVDWGSFEDEQDTRIGKDIVSLQLRITRKDAIFIAKNGSSTADDQLSTFLWSITSYLSLLVMNVLMTAITQAWSLRCLYLTDSGLCLIGGKII